VSIKCYLGFHEWERHGGEYVPPDLKLPPEVHIRRDGTHLIRPQPTGYISERFVQCIHCDVTQWGWPWKNSPCPPPTPVSRPVAHDRFGRAK